MRRIPDVSPLSAGPGATKARTGARRARVPGFRGAARASRRDGRRWAKPWLLIDIFAAARRGRIRRFDVVAAGRDPEKALASVSDWLREIAESGAAMKPEQGGCRRRARALPGGRQAQALVPRDHPPGRVSPGRRPGQVDPASPRLSHPGVGVRRGVGYAVEAIAWRRLALPCAEAVGFIGSAPSVPIRRSG